MPSQKLRRKKLRKAKDKGYSFNFSLVFRKALVAYPCAAFSHSVNFWAAHLHFSLHTPGSLIWLPCQYLCAPRDFQLLLPPSFLLASPVQQKLKEPWLIIATAKIDPVLGGTRICVALREHLQNKGFKIIFFSLLQCDF